MTDTATSPTTLVVRRTVNAPRDRVFAAWTNPDIMRTILSPEGVTIGALTVDARVGGAYNIEMMTPKGPMTVRGVYQEFAVPTRVAYTWKWDEDDAADEHESLVTVEFGDKDAQTEVVLTHERLRNEASRDGHTHGWNSILDKLVANYA